MNKMKTIKNQNGAVLIEFVIVLPLLILLLFASIEFGVALFDKAMITNASREGARAGIVFNSPTRLSDADIQKVAQDYCKANLITFGAANDPAVTVSYPDGKDSGDPLTVTVQYNYGFLVVPRFIPGFNPSITLRGVSVMRYE